MATQNNAFYALASNPNLALSSGFKKRGHQTQWQGGADFSTLSPDDIALKLGSSGYTPGYDSNQKGSFESAFNSILNNLTPQQMVGRYEKGTTPMFQTGLDQLNYQAYQTAKSILGRDISGEEFAQILPAFQGPNGLLNGRAFLSNMAQMEQSDPSNPNSPWNPNNPKNKLGQFNDAVASQFKSILGRDATADELQHFGGLLATNQLDSYGLSSFLKQMPEYTNARDKEFRSGLNDELAGYDQKSFDRMKGDVVSDYASRGINVSPSLDYALTDLMGKIAENRGKYLAGLSAEQYGGNKNLAVDNYKNTLDEMEGNSRVKRQQSMNYGQQLTDRGFEGADYNTTMGDYLRMVNGQNEGRNVLHTGDWINLGMGAINAGTRLYGASRPSPYSYLGG